MIAKTHSSEPDPPAPKLWPVIVRRVREADGEGLIFALPIIAFSIAVVLFAIAGAVWIIIRAAYGDFG